MRIRHALLAVVATAAVAACGGQQATSAAPAGAAPTGAASSPASDTPTGTAGKATPGTAGPLTIADPWIKTTKSGMTAAFGTIANPSAAAITIVSATSTGAPTVELHETVGEGTQMTMRPKEGGFTIPAGGKLELKPGGDHIMLMDVSTPVKPGSEVGFTLTFKDGGTMEFKAVGKDFAGANEKYQPGHE
ncbi:copper chaperone PCu(A)C [Nonomuraea sp. NPDC050547]|uniref:copper chaperone PCu(A)C n=1 Tax=unclassified Nonomuraea TaxID=2593643 RepID=UPI00378EAE48